MHMIYFQNSIIYNKEIITEFDNFYTVNLSTLMYSPNYEQSLLSTLTNKIFNLNYLLIPDNLIKIHYKENEYYLLVHPNIEELASAFDISLPILKFSDESDANKIRYKYINTIPVLTEKISNFINERNNFLQGKGKQIFEEYFEGQHEELSKLISNLNSTMKTNIIDVYEDFEYDNISERIERTTFKTVNHIHNYKSLKTFLKEIILNPNEYYGYHFNLSKLTTQKEYLKNLILEQKDVIETKKKLNNTEYELMCIQNTLHKINISKMFNKEKLSMLYIFLEKHIEQENAIDTFCQKILDNTLNTVEMNG